LARKKAAREANKEHKRNRNANKAALAEKQNAARQNAANSQPIQQTGSQNRSQNQGPNQTAGLTRKQRRKLREEQSREKNKARATFAEEEQAARQMPRSETLAENQDDHERLKNGAGKTKKMEEGNEDYSPIEKDRLMAGDETTKRVTRSQTFTLPQRPAKQAANGHQQKFQNQREPSKTATSNKLDQLPQADTPQPKQKKARKKRTPEEEQLRAQKLQKRAQKRQQKKTALKAAKQAEEIAARKALASLPKDLPNTQPIDAKDIARATLSPTTVEVLAAEDKRLAQSQAEKVKDKARKEARKAFEVAESVRYQELKAKGSVLANWELMKGRSTFPLDFWEDLAGTKMAAMSRGVGMYL
jgi:hypothetical protein